MKYLDKSTRKVQSDSLDKFTDWSVLKTLNIFYCGSTAKKCAFVHDLSVTETEFTAIYNVEIPESSLNRNETRQTIGKQAMTFHMARDQLNQS